MLLDNSEQHSIIPFQGRGPGSIPGRDKCVLNKYKLFKNKNIL